MDKFLTPRYRTLESVSDIISSHNFTQSAVRNDSEGISHGPRKFRSSETIALNIPQRKCPICNQNHPIRLCSEFLRMSVSERILSVRDHKCCTNCWAISHESKRCHSSNVCYICKQKSSHVANLLPGSPVNPFSPDRSLETTRSFHNFATRLQSTPSSTVLLGTAQVNIKLNNAMVSARVLSYFHL